VLQETRAVPKATEAELRVCAVGLNFRDVLNVMGASDFVGFWAWVILKKEAADFWGILVFGRDSHWGLYATPFATFGRRRPQLGLQTTVCGQFLALVQLSIYS